MKKFLICIFLSFLCIDLLYSQTINIITKEVNKGDSVEIRLQSYTGIIQWQKSTDSLIWNDITGATAYTFLFIADTITYIRASVTAGMCNPFLSDIAKISVNEEQKVFGTVTDIDGNEYITVIIGNQVWMAENLRTTKYNDGSLIPLEIENNNWEERSGPAYCWYNNDSTNYAETYGALYNWHTINTSILCPSGWHIPADDEWTELTDFLEDKNIDGNKLNEIGFKTPPGGYRSSNGAFFNIGFTGYWWSSTYLSVSTGAACNRFKSNNNYSDINRSFNDMSSGYSARCISNNLPENKPINISPIDKSIFQSITPTLKWSCNITKGKTISYAVYLDSIDASTLVSEGQNDTFYTSESINFNTIYYWKVVAIDGDGNETSGEVWSFKTTSDSSIIGTLSDIDGNTYRTITIGNQTWMEENIRTTRYADGTFIPLVTDNTKWTDFDDNNTDKGYCWYNNDSARYANTYGALYNFAAATNSDSSSSIIGAQGVCPSGWHLPSDQEWKVLEMYIGMSQAEADTMDWRGTNEGTLLKATNRWKNDGNGSDNHGFSALPGGSRTCIDGSYDYNGNTGYWWSSSESSNSTAYLRILESIYPEIRRVIYYKSYGFSVRCIKD
jgi:uncharacterized protein (TIGR02145 family)